MKTTIKSYVIEGGANQLLVLILYDKENYRKISPIKE